MRTIDHPKAVFWLSRIDELDPSFPHAQSVNAPVAPRTVMPTSVPQNDYYFDDDVRERSEQDKYYERENRRARLRDVGDGIYIIMLGLLLALWFFFSGLMTGIRMSTGPFEGGNLLMFCVGVGGILLGFIRMRTR